MTAVEIALVAETSGFRVRLDGNGDNIIHCRFEGGATNWLATLRHSRGLLHYARSVIPVLCRFGIRVECSAGNVQLARIGSGVTQNGLARLLRLPSAHLGR